ncbi:hypothetical protein BDY19DRAFT_281043 [Irpex rosettiformis]|uniref:Uncharacterized protein n=1 Tax=Irpex rosettiformis TaxID=378272 RepID=A0ACB8UI03_9APHY|nr:hypothetical protein BDY19DRAFT_281043 [Irpex rosettiformis]
MSSRYDNRRRDYDRGDYERDRDRGQRYNDRPPHRDRRDGRSRSRSPRRGGGADRDKRPIGMLFTTKVSFRLLTVMIDRRDYGRDRNYRDDRRRDDRDRDRDRKEIYRDDERREPRESERDRREPLRRDPGRERDGGHRAGDRGTDSAHRLDGRSEPLRGETSDKYTPTGSEEAKSRQLSEMPTEDGEEGEAMDATNEDDAAMMAMMGLTGFGTTKGKRVEGNQEGSANVKKIRTWRQYMNRRGGFNRPLDKIK